MLKAVLRQGVIVPLEPLPPEWEEGTVLEVAKAAAPPLDIDAWAEYMNLLCADSLPEDEEIMRRAVEEHRQQAKLQAKTWDRQLEQDVAAGRLDRFADEALRDLGEGRCTDR